MYKRDAPCLERGWSSMPKRFAGATSEVVDRRLTRPFEPDVLLPSQFYLKKHLITQVIGERRLQFAVLEDGIECFQKHAYAKDIRGKKLFTDAYEWIMSPEKTWLYSFELLCEAFELNSDYIRTGLQRWRANVEPPNE
jgi:hypothetical protein